LENGLKAFLALAPTSGMREGEILSRYWSDIDLDPGNPCIYVRQTKNDEPKRIQLPDMTVTALRALPSFGHHEYAFPAKPNRRFKGNFKTPHGWDFISGRGSGGWRSLRASMLCASMISAVSPPRP
jgi:integrase